jgi:hypothetical protein
LRHWRTAKNATFYQDRLGTNISKTQNKHAFLVDHFTVRWSGTITFPEAVVTFSASSDDGSRLWVDGALVIDHATDCCATWTSDPVPLQAGAHELVSDFRSRSNVEKETLLS